MKLLKQAVLCVWEWDKRRKFGCKFGDAVILYMLCVVSNVMIRLSTGVFNIPFLLISTAITAGLTGRRPSE